MRHLGRSTAQQRFSAHSYPVPCKNTHWNRSSTESMESPSLEKFQHHLDTTPSLCSVRPCRSREAGPDDPPWSNRTHSANCVTTAGTHLVAAANTQKITPQFLPNHAQASLGGEPGARVPNQLQHAALCSVPAKGKFRLNALRSGGRRAREGTRGSPSAEPLHDSLAPPPGHDPAPSPALSPPPPLVAARLRAPAPPSPAAAASAKSRESRAVRRARAAPCRTPLGAAGAPPRPAAPAPRTEPGSASRPRSARGPAPCSGRRSPRPPARRATRLCLSPSSGGAGGPPQRGPGQSRGAGMQPPEPQPQPEPSPQRSTVRGGGGEAGLWGWIGGRAGPPRCRGSGREARVTPPFASPSRRAVGVPPPRAGAGCSRAGGADGLPPGAGALLPCVGPGVVTGGGSCWSWLLFCCRTPTHRAGKTLVFVFGARCGARRAECPGIPCGCPLSRGWAACWATDAALAA